MMKKIMNDEESIDGLYLSSLLEEIDLKLSSKDSIVYTYIDTEPRDGCRCYNPYSTWNSPICKGDHRTKYTRQVPFSTVVELLSFIPKSISRDIRKINKLKKKISTQRHILNHINKILKNLGTSKRGYKL